MSSCLDRVRSVTPWVLREGISLVLPCGREFGAIPERPSTLDARNSTGSSPAGRDAGTAEACHAKYQSS